MKGKRVFVRSIVFLLVLLLAGIQAIPVALASEDGDVTVSTVRLHTFGTSDAIPGTVSTLVRRAGGVSLSVDTLGLNPGEVYTIWWVIFNNPSACSEGGCVGPDLSNPETEATVGYATGEIADENGMATFRAVLAVGDNSFALGNDAGFPFELVLPSPGLSDPFGAEIHAVLRTHGPALDDPSSQLDSFNDGCNPECFNVQAALHYPADAWSLDDESENIVVAVISAPVDANGIMAGEPSGLNIFLSAQGTDAAHFGDPRHFGHQIPAGGWMEIELGGTFERNGVDNDAEFVAFEGNSYLIPLVGLPQNPIVAAAGDGAQHGNYTVSDDGEHTIILTPNGGEGANGLEGARAGEVGLKTLHILPQLGSTTGPATFTNGPADTEGTVAVRIYDADGALIESGSGSLIFPASPGRQVAGVNFGFGTPGSPFSPDTVEAENITASNYQVVAPGTQMVNTLRGESFAAGAPYALRYMIFEAQELQPDSFSPFAGIPGVGLVVDADDPSVASLVQDSNGDGVLDDTDESIGSVSITGPDGQPSGSILAVENWPLTTAGDGVEGANGSVLNVPVQVGNLLGYQEVTVSLDGGGSATLYVIVEDPNGEKIANAMSAGPERISAEAAILDWPSDDSGELTELRAGSNGWSCLPDDPSTPTNDPMCLDANWLEFIHAIIGGRDPVYTAVGLGYMLQGGSSASPTDYTLLEPPAGEEWGISGPHLMVVSPGDLDPAFYSTDPASGGPWIMWEGTPYEHLMVPVVVK